MPLPLAICSCKFKKNDNYSGYFWHKRKAKAVTNQKDAASNKITKKDGSSPKSVGEID